MGDYQAGSLPRQAAVAVVVKVDYIRLDIAFEPQEPFTGKGDIYPGVVLPFEPEAALI